MQLQPSVGIAVEQQRLYHRGQRLRNELSFGSYGIRNNEKVYVLAGHGKETHMSTPSSPSVLTLLTAPSPALLHTAPSPALELDSDERKKPALPSAPLSAPALTTLTSPSDVVTAPERRMARLAAAAKYRLSGISRKLKLLIKMKRPDPVDMPAVDFLP